MGRFFDDWQEPTRNTSAASWRDHKQTLGIRTPQRFIYTHCRWLAKPFSQSKHVQMLTNASLIFTRATA